MNLLLQSLICAVVFFGYGLGLHGYLTRFELAPMIVMISLIQITISYIWLSQFQHGPAEWVWRRLTNFNLVPLKNNKKESTSYEK